MIIEKDGQIIVTELRSMSEAPKSKRLLLAYYGKRLHEGYIDSWGNIWIEGIRNPIKRSDITGFVNMPIYQPQE